MEWLKVSHLVAAAEAPWGATLIQPHLFNFSLLGKGTTWDSHADERISRLPKGDDSCSFGGNVLEGNLPVILVHAFPGWSTDKS